VQINVLRQEKSWSSRRLLRKFPWKNWAWTSVDRLLKKMNPTGVTERPKERRNFGKYRTCGKAHLQSWKCSACTCTKVRTKLKGRMDISLSPIRRIAKHDL